MKQQIDVAAETIAHRLRSCRNDEERERYISAGLSLDLGLLAAKVEEETVQQLRDVSEATPDLALVPTAFDEAVENIHRAFCYPDEQAGDWDRDMAEAMRRRGYVLLHRSRIRSGATEGDVERIDERRQRTIVRELHEAADMARNIDGVPGGSR